MKYAMIKLGGWDAVFTTPIGKQPIRVANILVECMNIENEKIEAEMRRAKSQSRRR